MRLPVYCGTCCGIVQVDAQPGDDTMCPDCSSGLHVSVSEDVFISFSFKDLDAANRVARGLSAGGVRAWAAPERIAIADDFLRAITNALQNARAYVLLLSPASAGSDWVRKELLIAVERRLPIFALVVAPMTIPPDFRTALAGSLWDESFDRPLEDRLASLARGVVKRLQAEVGKRADLSNPTSPPPERKLRGVRHDESPYVGPKPFDSNSRGRFFGREHETRNLLERLGENRAVILYAPSGAGKSSLLDASLRDGLERSGAEVLTRTRVGVSLPESMRQRADEISNIFSYSAVAGLAGESVQHPKSTLAGYLAANPERHDAWARVVVIDQFEELFTQHTDRYEDRAGFIADLCNALARHPKLRIVLGIRQEYMATLDDFIDQMPPEFRPAKVKLRRLEGEAALDAIRRPAEQSAVFADGVAQEILRQLNLMQVVLPNGKTVKKRGEFIELVHLQIVCRRLWSRLPEGIERIEMEHLKLAAGDGRPFDHFVENALVEFYDEVVGETAQLASLKGKQHGAPDFPPELIRLGCLKFVNSAAIRLTLQQDRESGRTGRLPNWIVDQLERLHLLRAEWRGGVPWYELSHDLLAETISRGRDRELELLLAATELLETILKRVRTEHPGGLSGYFKPHQELLVECGPFRSQPGLFEDEASLVFRASLVSGHDMEAWSARVKTDYPAVHAQVLAEAIGAEAVEVRANAAQLLSRDPIESLTPKLVGMALNDADAHVRRTAAESLARLDRTELYEQLVRTVESREQRPAAIRALSSILVLRDQQGIAANFDPWFDKLSGEDRARVRYESRRTRLKDSLVVLPYVLIPSAVLSAIAAAVFKSIPGVFGWSLCQSTASFMGGLFHGATAGLIWGVTLPLSLVLYWEVFGSRRHPGSMMRPLGSMAFASVCGLITGLVVVMIIAGAFEVANLVEIGWLDEWHAQGELAFWLDLFTRTRYGWAYAITGVGLGLGMAMSTNALRANRSLRDLLQGDGGVSDFGQIMELVREVHRRVRRKMWPTLVLPFVAGMIALPTLRTGNMALQPASSTSAKAVREHGPTHATWLASKTTPWGRFVGMVVDCGSEAVGGYAAVVGMGVGMVIISRGVQVKPRRNLG